jgi:hypothetical protein
VAKWKIVAGPREFTSTPQGHDMAVGWAYNLDGPSGKRTTRVIVSGTAAAVASLPDESARAIGSKGKTAVQAYLDKVVPPRTILVTTDGLREHDE